MCELNHIFLFLLDLNAGEILQMFGKMFFVFCQESGYDTILRVLGSNVREFLQVRFLCQTIPDTGDKAEVWSRQQVRMECRNKSCIV